MAIDAFDLLEVLLTDYVCLLLEVFNGSHSQAQQDHSVSTLARQDPYAGILEITEVEHMVAHIELRINEAYELVGVEIEYFLRSIWSDHVHKTDRVLKSWIVVG